MNGRTLLLGSILILTAPLVRAATQGGSVIVTGAPNPATTELSGFSVPANLGLEIVGVVPVVATVVGAPASMAANVFMPSGSAFNYCGTGTPTTCENSVWIAQWTIVSTPSGIQAVNSFQGGTLKLVNNSAGSATVNFRCQVGQMTGSCIFAHRFIRTVDPVF
ncbi:MAG: hypothetical protein LC796_15870 [Acidobacteria bacterium]|nr:hypothetical protein [Acidobacteriota bacterium]